CLCWRGGGSLGANIIGGWKVPDGSMQFMASLQDNGVHVCGGFLISEDFVLTAAHCEKANSLVLSTHHLPPASSDMRYNVKKCKHPDYKDVYLGNDIMLLKDKDNTESTKYTQGSVQIVELGSVSDTSCQVAGWGYTSNENREPVNDLQQVSVQIVKDKDCKKKWGTLPQNTFCAGGMETGKGICQCDSGGPLVCNNKAVGIVSYNRNGNCDYKKNKKNDFPNVYTDISKFLPWINEIVKKGDC
uniref:Peptidase S1 domain-containing protein n=1 Tax=Neogobius melanostomus TaxID=47308 RepID=A0A8C6WKQ1_9GOBI